MELDEIRAALVGQIVIDKIGFVKFHPNSEWIMKLSLGWGFFGNLNWILYWVSNIFIIIIITLTQRPLQIENLLEVI